jgi:Uma2 family endonuclease
MARDDSRATEDDLRAAPEDGHKHELVDGAIVVSPAGTRHGFVSGRLLVRLGAFVEAHDLGYVVDSSTGFRLPNGNVRLPDVAFVARGRFPDERVPEDSSDVPPDLAADLLA